MEVYKSRFWLELALTLAGVGIAAIGGIARLYRWIGARQYTHWLLGLTILSLFLIGFGLLALLGTEPFALPVLVVGILGLFLSWARYLFLLLQLGLILMASSLYR